MLAVIMSIILRRVEFNVAFALADGRMLLIDSLINPSMGQQLINMSRVTEKSSACLLLYYSSALIHPLGHRPASLAIIRDTIHARDSIRRQSLVSLRCKNSSQAPTVSFSLNAPSCYSPSVNSPRVLWQFRTRFCPKGQTTCRCDRHGTPHTLSQ
jgi:hypothetical protein